MKIIKNYIQKSYINYIVNILGYDNVYRNILNSKTV